MLNGRTSPPCPGSPWRRSTRRRAPRHVALPVDIRRTMSRPTFEPAQGPLPEPAPEPAGRGPKRCEGCGTITGLLIFVPNRLGGGRRVCLGCLRALDALREAPRRRAMAETDQEQLQAATVMLARVFHARLTRGTRLGAARGRALGRPVLGAPAEPGRADSRRPGFRTMSPRRSSPLDGPSPERSAPVGSPQPICVVCGGPRDPRKREACSDQCRAALSRQRREDTQRTRDEEVRALLETGLKKLGRERP